MKFAPHVHRLAGLLLLSCVVGCSEKIDTPEEFRELGDRHERDGELQDAVAAYETSIRLDPDSAFTQYKLGVVRVQQDRLNEAITAYSKAIALDDSIAPAFNNRAAVFAEQQQFERAIEDFSRAIELDPQDALVWHNRGLARHDLGQFDAARADFDESIRIDGRNPSTYIDRGRVFLEQRLWQRALEDFDSARRLDESLPDVWFNRAHALAGLGRIDDARAAAGLAESLGADMSDFNPERITADPKTIAAGVDVARAGPTTEVIDWLAKRDMAAISSDPPWDLKTTGDAPVYFLIREAETHDGMLEIHFRQSDFELLAAAPDIRTDLVFVEAVTADDGVSGSSSWRIISVIENWTPDFDQLEPRTWSLSVDRPNVPNSGNSLDASSSR